MGIYEGIKDVAKVVQQADNVDLYKKLLDLSAQALDMQDELSRLRTENEELRKQRDLDRKVVRHKSPYITLAGEPNDICYCAACWGKNRELIQMHVSKDYGSHHFHCCNCNNHFFAVLED